jgi:hypothetical protein
VPVHGAWQERPVLPSDPTRNRGARGSREGLRRHRPQMRDVPPGIISPEMQAKYEIHNWRNAAHILAGAYPVEWADIMEVLGSFVLRKSDVIVGGKNKSNISDALDSAFTQRGWTEREVVTAVTVDEDLRESRTHKIDCLKSRVGLEIEWNSKDQTFVRDLNNFRVLFDLHVLDVGVIVTRADHLQQIFGSAGSRHQIRR